MPHIRTLTTITKEELSRLTTGYTATTQYTVTRTKNEQEMTFTLRLEDLPEPRHVRYAETDDDDVERYQNVLSGGCSFGAYEEGDTLVGFIIAEHHEWNHTLWVWEFQVAPEQRGRGLGRGLIEAVFRAAKERGIRAVVCETQTRNTPAIAFYRRMGFEMDGVDVSYYSNEDMDKQDIAVFMKRRF